MLQYNITIGFDILHYIFTTGTKDEKLAMLLESILNQILAYLSTEQIKA